ncbi:hypothetical protein M1N21_03150 [Dehalococcoidia bacterium]|nr:hypothetical protein [Dehalococcoidia bacterium]
MLPLYRLTLSLVPEEQERELWLRSLLTHRDFTLYCGLRCLLSIYLFLVVPFGIPFLVFLGGQFGG